MTRDFTEESFNTVIGIIDEVNPRNYLEQKGNYIAVISSEAQGWIEKLGIDCYLEALGAFYNKLIDKNDASRDGIRNVFKCVNEIDTEFTSRFLSLYVSYEEFQDALKSLISVIAPDSNSFTAEYIGNGLKSFIEDKKKYMKLCSQAANTGITQDDISDTAIADYLFEVYGTYLFQLCPCLELGQEFSIPIGPGVTMYYSIKGELNPNSGIKISSVIEDHQKKLSVETKDYLDRNECSYSKDDGFTYSYVDGITGYKTSIDLKLEGMSIEKSVTTDFGEYGSVESTIGVRFENTGWRPLPVPVPVTAPAPSPMPAFDNTWEKIGKGMIIAGVLIGAVAVGVLLAPVVLPALSAAVAAVAAVGAEIVTGLASLASFIYLVR